ncbi:MAG TPA: 2Fe-2S iron-sulfur cluster-binding protein [Terriglobales bacterium]|nr:2Fe-2S iron-sulfur cluster-binding protein [Terriglobales bacterium]
MQPEPPQPQYFNVTLVTPEGEHSIPVGSDQHIWEAAATAGLRLPAMCHMGHCLTCAGKLEGPGEFDQSDARQYLPQDRAASYILLCTAKPRSDLRIRTHQQRAMRRFRLDAGLPAPYAGV